MNKINKSTNNSIKNYFLKALNAFKGLYTVFKEEKSFIAIFIIIVISYVIAGIYYYKMGLIHWIILILVNALMIVVEIINTAIENIVDLINFKYGINAKKIKNISSAASLVIIISGLIIYLILFINVIA
ncbi:Diacylglycerol kinase family protein [[Mycoplasma] cavipharyngis]|uniref:diacylglycerol kinase n=1 Tax=[Mycoplasma] cavipharyngis TaxID=92757 RepID=UPI003704854A